MAQAGKDAHLGSALGGWQQQANACPCEPVVSWAVPGKSPRLHMHRTCSAEAARPSALASRAATSADSRLASFSWAARAAASRCARARADSSCCCLLRSALASCASRAGRRCASECQECTCRCDGCKAWGDYSQSLASRGCPAQQHGHNAPRRGGKPGKDPESCTPTPTHLCGRHRRLPRLLKHGRPAANSGPEGREACLYTTMPVGTARTIAAPAAALPQPANAPPRSCVACQHDAAE